MTSKPFSLTGWLVMNFCYTQSNGRRQKDAVKWREVTDDGQQAIVTAAEPPAQATQSKTTNLVETNTKCQSPPKKKEIDIWSCVL